MKLKEIIGSTIVVGIVGSCGVMGVADGIDKANRYRENPSIGYYCAQGLFWGWVGVAGSFCPLGVFMAVGGLYFFSDDETQKRSCGPAFGGRGSLKGPAPEPSFEERQRRSGEIMGIRSETQD